MPKHGECRVSVVRTVVMVVGTCLWPGVLGALGPEICPRARSPAFAFHAQTTAVRARACRPSAVPPHLDQVTRFRVSGLELQTLWTYGPYMQEKTYICSCIHVCMYACMYVCMHACMHA